jgi:hypothetical protein
VRGGTATRTVAAGSLQPGGKKDVGERSKATLPCVEYPRGGPARDRFTLVLYSAHRP